MRERTEEEKYFLAEYDKFVNNKETYEKSRMPWFAAKHFFELGQKYKEANIKKNAIDGRVVKDINNALSIRTDIIYSGGLKFGDGVKVLYFKER